MADNDSLRGLSMALGLDNSPSPLVNLQSHGSLRSFLMILDGVELTSIMRSRLRSDWRLLVQSADLEIGACSKVDSRERLRAVALTLRNATLPDDRRSAVKEFLAAMSDLIAQLLRFLVELLILLLSQLLGHRTGIDDARAWSPEPIDAFPQVAPRGPNSAFPVFTHRGGRQRSTLGSVVLAA